ncbi:MAG: sensor histidine kinase [Verrucomicrobiae bacterium]|nr:sensor histidine kinase [Verrucomicrobiae bacterium]
MKPAAFLENWLGTARSRWGWISVGLLLVVAFIDYIAGYELQFSIFYLIPIYLASWFKGWRAGLSIGIASAVFSLVGDIASGARYKIPLVPWWNCVISVVIYSAMVSALHRLRESQRQLEARVAERTSELRREIEERQNLEKALLEVSEREQRRIGHDIHDGLCQHLTSAAIASEVIAEKLRAKGLPEAVDAEQVVEIVEDGIGIARSLARGLAPVELDVLGLSSNLRELCRNTSARTRTACSFELNGDVDPGGVEAVVHLFRIAQEAVNNAIRHSGATEVRIRLTNLENGIGLQIDDNGNGLPPAAKRSSGMGLHIMRHRASLIGARFDIINLQPGTRIAVCIPPVSRR